MSKEQLKQAALAMKQMREKLDRIEAEKHEPIAVVGMACRFPGNSNSPKEYWDLLNSGGNAIAPIPEGRWDVDEFYDPTPGQPGRMYTREGGYISADIRGFDPGLFGMSPREAKTLDPQQRLSLELAYEALENAGMNPDSLIGSRSGVFYGASVMDYGLNAVFNGDVKTIDLYGVSGNTPSIMSGRISYTFGWQGPTFNMDTACSSSLVATHLAINSLRNGECNMALTGGVLVILRPEATIAFSGLGMLAHDSRCKTFSAGADGYARSEGGGVILLKRLSDAVRDGDNILATLRGSAINHDGRSGGLTVPNGPAQEALIREALQNSKLEPNDIDYIEAHGTGTPLGDPIEVHAMKNVFAEGREEDKPLRIGSVKTNIGHLEPASGIAGLMKVVLSMQNEKLPKHLNFTEWNPHIQREGFPVEVTTEPVDWKSGGKARFAGVSSFGLSGTNAHVIVGEPPELEREAKQVRELNILTLSAKTEAALKELASEYLECIENPTDANGKPVDSSVVATTTNLGRSHMDYRLAVVGKDASELKTRLEAGEGLGVFRGVRSKARRRIAFLFTGQGSQYAGMGKTLFDSEPVFRATMERCEAIFKDERGESLLEVMFEEGGERVNQTGYTQPALFALQASLVDLWKSYGVTPDTVLGHSVGEFAAAYAAGVLELEDSFRIISARGRLMQALPTGGAMAALRVDEKTAEEAIAEYGDKLAVAAINGPESVVISGEESAVDAVVKAMTAKEVRAQKLTVSHAFHSPLMDPMLSELGDIGDRVKYQESRINFVSTKTGQPLQSGEMNGEYWKEHARGAVRYAEAVSFAASEYKCDLFLEIGPQPTLSSLGRQSVTDDNVEWVPSLRRGRDASLAMTEAVAHFYTVGGDVDWAGYHGDTTGPRALLPNYPYQKKEFWIEMPKVAGGKSGRASEHPLLGKKLRSAGRETIYELTLTPTSPEYVQDHQVYGATVFPGTGYFELALAAAKQLSNGANLQVTEVGVEAPLVLDGDEATTVQVVVDEADDSGARTLEIFSESGGNWLRHTLCKLAPTDFVDDHVADLDALKATCPVEEDTEEMYRDLADHGLMYGPMFQGVMEISTSDNSSFACLDVPDDAEQYLLHPAMFDASLHCLASLAEVEDDVTYLPVGLDSIDVSRSVIGEVFCHARLRDESTKELIIGDLDLYDGSGNRIARVLGVRAKRVTRQTLEKLLGTQSRSDMYEIGWKRSEAVAFDSSFSERYILVGEGNYSDAFASALKDAGQTVVSAKADGVVEAIGEGAKAVVYMGACSAPHGENTGSGIEKYQEYVAADLLALTQSMGRMEQPPRLHLVTRGGVPVDGAASDISPLQSLVWGFGRVVENEHPNLGPSLIDLDPAQDVAATGKTLLDELGSDKKENQVGYRSDTRYVARLQPTHQKKRPSNDVPRQLMSEELGSLDGLVWAQVDDVPVGANDVKVRVRACGMNFRDVLKALDVYPEDDRVLGDESAGEVVEIGKDVTDVKVGDRVLLAAPGGCHRNFMVMPSESVAVLPENISYAQAVTIPVTFLTAMHCLEELAKVKKGDRVLIHCGAGGVGLAAIQIAKQAGATVFTTAGSPRKRAYVKNIAGADYVMDSRALKFGEEIMEFTKGEGIDVVLNSLVGESIVESMKTLREGGRFVEIGKAELWNQERVAKEYPGVTYTTVALDKKGVGPGLLRKLLVPFEKGDYKPLPWRGFPIEQTVDAYRYMSAARHIGKVVITQYEDDRSPVLSNGSYLITGGLGGLGLGVARHFAEQGAGAVVLMGRSAPKEAAVKAIAEIEALGTSVRVVRGDVSVADDVKRVMTELDGLPVLRGIVHSAGVLEDKPILDQDKASFLKVFGPKVQGAWNLHQETAKMPLDFFVVFSSISAIIGNYAQSNYSAANSFLDALAHHRLSHGMPATSVNWGAWAGAGMADDEDLRKSLKSRGMDFLDPEYGFELLDKAILRGAPQVSAVSVRWDRFLSFMGSESPFFDEVIGGAGGGGGSVKLIKKEQILAELRQTPESNREQYLFEFVEGLLKRVLLMPEDTRIDPGTPLQDLGFDSMMAVEMGNALSAAVGFKLSATVGFDYPTPGALTGFLCEKILPEVGEAASSTKRAETEEEEALAKPANSNKEQSDVAVMAKGER